MLTICQDLPGRGCRPYKSPKAGQGLNVSIQDTYNLGWKLPAVIIGLASPRILSTYEVERRPVAEKLVQMDAEFVRAYEQGNDRTTCGKGHDIEAVEDYFSRVFTGRC